MAKTYRKRNPADVAWCLAHKNTDNSGTMWGKMNLWNIAKTLSESEFLKWISGDGMGIKLNNAKRILKRIAWKRMRKHDRMECRKVEADNDIDNFMKMKPSVLWDIY